MPLVHNATTTRPGPTRDSKHATSTKQEPPPLLKTETRPATQTNATVATSVVSAGHDAHTISSPPAPQSWQSLDTMERKARELCEDTRRQYELLMQRQQDHHDRQMQSLQCRLQQVVGESLSLSEHRQMMNDLARAHERDVRALVKAHDDQLAQFRQRFKQLANEQQTQNHQAHTSQVEKNQLLDRLTEVEMERDDAVRAIRETELVLLNVQKELEDTTQSKRVLEGKLQEACHHLASLKAQTAKLDRVHAKLKHERTAHTAAMEKLHTQLRDECEARVTLKARVDVLEAELVHFRSVCTSHCEELTTTKRILETRDVQIAELQRSLVEITTKEALHREFRERERAVDEQRLAEAHAALARLQSQDMETKQQLTVATQAGIARDLECQRLQSELDQRVQTHSKIETSLTNALQATRAKHSRTKQLVVELRTALAEHQDEHRLNQLLFPVTKPSQR